MVYHPQGNSSLHLNLSKTNFTTCGLMKVWYLSILMSFSFVIAELWDFGTFFLYQITQVYIDQISQKLYIKKYVIFPVIFDFLNYQHRNLNIRYK
jgi:hypothetical protein